MHQVYFDVGRRKHKDDKKEFTISAGGRVGDGYGGNGIRTAGRGASAGERGPHLTADLTAVRWQTRAKYSCAGPAGFAGHGLEASAAGTKSFLVLVHDPEPHPGKGLTDITHWLIWNIPATATGLPEAVPAGATLPDGSHQMKRGNGANAAAAYGGPCAPPGPDHHYTYELWALDTMLDVGEGGTRADVMKAADGHFWAQRNGSACSIARPHRSRYFFKRSVAILKTGFFTSA